MKITRDGTMTVIKCTPMEEIGLLHLVSHTALNDVLREAEAAGEEVNAAAVKVVLHELYVGLRGRRRRVMPNDADLVFIDE